MTMWRWLLAGILIVLAGLGAQLVMVVGVLGPSLALALAGYAALFIGVLVSLVGILRALRTETGYARSTAYGAARSTPER
jgi:uncharacterized membrane protein